MSLYLSGSLKSDHAPHNAGFWTRTDEMSYLVPPRRETLSKLHYCWMHFVRNDEYTWSMNQWSFLLVTSQNMAFLKIDSNTPKAFHVIRLLLYISSYVYSTQRIADWCQLPLFTSEEQLCANLRVQEQSTNIMSQCHYLAFTWGHRSTVVPSHW